MKGLSGIRQYLAKSKYSVYQFGNYHTCECFSISLKFYVISETSE